MTEKFTDKLNRLIEGDESAADGTATVGGVEMPMMEAPELSEELLETWEYHPGYRYEKVLLTPRGYPDGAYEHERVIAEAGGYVGDPERAEMLIKKRGIRPRLSGPDGGNGKHTCSIGFCEKEQKWYGWSHRAIFGFGVGDVVKEGDCTNSSGLIEEYLAEHPEEDLSLPVGFEAKTLEDCKRMAVAFADSVG